MNDNKSKKTMRVFVMRERIITISLLIALHPISNFLVPSRSEDKS